MKLWKFLFTSLILCSTFTLISCSEKKENESVNDNDSIINTIDSDNSSQNSLKDDNLSDTYLSVNITNTTTTLANGSVEDTVAQVYDSVVAIDSYLNNQLYGSGSGVLFGYDDCFSYVATCHHVIEDCQNFKITLSNDETYVAQLVGGDAESDIAVLAVEKTNLTYATWFEDTDQLRLGSSVICIGNPLGTLPGSVSTGVVSYNNRVVQVDSYHKMNLIQTDVAINSGNSGGGLFNSAGALIGIVNAKYSSTGIEGLGFAIPANQARSIIESILTTAKYNLNDNSWETGYVEGRWEIGFTLGYGGYGFYRTTVGIASVATNPTHSDYDKLQVNDMLNAITIKYNDSSKEILSITNITAQTTTVEMIYKLIYEADLAIGDAIVLEITRGNDNLTIEIPLVQYRYMI